MTEPEDRRKWRKQYFSERATDHLGGLLTALDTLRKLASEDGNEEAREAFTRAHEDVIQLAEKLLTYL